MNKFRMESPAINKIKKSGGGLVFMASVRCLEGLSIFTGNCVRSTLGNGMWSWRCDVCLLCWWPNDMPQNSDLQGINCFTTRPYTIFHRSGIPTLRKHHLGELKHCELRFSSNTYYRIHAYMFTVCSCFKI